MDEIKMKIFHIFAYLTQEVKQKMTMSLTIKLMKIISAIEVTIPYKPAKLKRTVSRNWERIKTIAARRARLVWGKTLLRKAKKRISTCWTSKNTLMEAMNKRGEGVRIVRK